MRAIVLDCAVAGGWNFRAAWNDPKQGQCVRVAYACLGPTAVFESGCLIVQPSRELVVTRENQERGGITMDGLKAEGFTGDGLARHIFWKRLEEAEMVISFCQPFHIGAVSGFAAGLGIDLAGYPGPACTDVMVTATPLAKVEWPNASQNRTGRDRYKAPSLAEAHDAIIGGSLAEKRDRTIAEPKPLAAFARVQVDAVLGLHKAMNRAPDVSRFAMA